MLVYVRTKNVRNYLQIQSILVSFFNVGGNWKLDSIR